MKFNKSILAGLMVVTMLTAVGCGSAQQSTSSDSDKKTEQKAEDTKKADEVAGVSLENPIKVDKEAGTITILSQVNGKYFTEPTRHASVFKDGGNGAKSIFTAYATPVDFYNGLIEIGAKPGENMTLDNKETTHVEGTPIKVSVTWNGADKEYDINDVIKDSNGKKLEFKFGGNLENAKSKNTGCIACLDSCPVGIISNTTYTYGAVEKRGEVKFTGNADVLPEDGTYVALTYSIQK